MFRSTVNHGPNGSDAGAIIFFAVIFAPYSGLSFFRLAATARKAWRAFWR